MIGSKNAPSLTRNAASYRLRLLSLHSAIVATWPQNGWFGWGGLSSKREESIYQILRALPLPLPVNTDDKPGYFFQAADKNLLAVIDAVVDAGFVLLGNENLGRLYPAPLARIETGTSGRLTLSLLPSPSVEYLLDLLVGGLEAVAQVIVA
jgi:hypothetical protein